MPKKKRSKATVWLRVLLFLLVSYGVLAITFDFVALPGVKGLPAPEPGIEVASPVIRFHVLAHSDDPGDQALKNRVRDVALEYVHTRLGNKDSLDEVRSLLKQEQNQIQTRVEDSLQEWGLKEKVEVIFTTMTFPTRLYAGKVYPAGDYETFQIILGEGEGKNWWCVIFPPLCLTELALIREREEIVDKETVRSPQFTDYDSAPPPLKFKLWEWLTRIIRDSREQKVNCEKI